MRYLRPAWRLHDPAGVTAGAMRSLFSDGAGTLSPRDLGRIGGEMVRRMADAALEFLLEKSASETRASFRSAVSGIKKPSAVRRIHPRRAKGIK